MPVARGISAGVLAVLLAVAGAGAGPHLLSRTFSGSDDRSYLGSWVASAGDVDADGIGDLIVGAPGAGYARVYSGADGTALYTRIGTTSGDSFGRAVGWAGDVDGDGCDDFIVGAAMGDYAKVYSGRDGSLLHLLSGSTGDYFGYSVAGVGDLDGDAHADVAVGAPRAFDDSGIQTGTVTVFRGSDGTVLHEFHGDANQDLLGFSLNSAGDVDDDGVRDIIAGAQWGASPDGGSHPGLARIWSGADGSEIFTWYGPSDWSLFGYSVDGVGDWDGDGDDDVIVGAPFDDEAGIVDAGSAWVLAADGTKLCHFEADGGSDQFGYSVAGAGDLNGDGVGDALVGANLARDGNQIVTGIVRAFSGADSKALFTIEGTAAIMSFGESVDGIGDLNGDGRADIVVGAPTDDVGALDSGSAIVYVSPSPTGTVTIDGGARATASTAVSLSLTWQAGTASVSDMRLRNAGDDWGAWQALAASIAWTIPAVEGERTVEVQFRDSDGLVSGPRWDSIHYDLKGPIDCSIRLAGGAAWTNSTTVSVTLSCSDAVSGVEKVRLRNSGGQWGDWVDVAPTVPHVMTAGPGTKTVEAEFRDFAGNESGVAEDSIGVDLAAPAISSFNIDSGAGYTGSLDVTLSLSASDSGGSGLTEMRFRQAGEATFGGWMPYAASHATSLPPRDGKKHVEAQVRDAAGNESSIAFQQIVLDQTGPSVTAFTVNGGRPYVAPGEDVTIDLTATDAGSGPDSFAVTYDGGASWTSWVAVAPGAVPVDRPTTAGTVPVRVRVRDRLGNVSSTSSAVTAYFIEANPLSLGTGGSFSGAMSGRTDVDALAINLLAGDVLTVRMKALGTDRRAGFPLVLDLVAPDGTRLVTGATAIPAQAAAVTGRHLVVLRMTGADGSDTGTYALSAKVKLAAAHARGEGVCTGSFTIPAADGALLKVALSAPGLDPASIVLTGPKGAATTTVAGAPGRAKFATTLDQGTGTYTVSFTAAGPAAVSWSVKLPKGEKLTEYLIRASRP